ncbi:MAG: LemA family protein [Rhodoferax sp.]|uniref:LemA family protein n=1 Tax=Rhodoferax sp. TaxID=50421 RepID=UPI003018720C
MSDSVVVWVSIAVLIFWSMGAYNRLVRLRSHGITAFAALEGMLNQHVLIVKANAPLAEEQLPELKVPYSHDEATHAWIGLTAAADQFNASLKAAHAKPLNGATMLALRTALETLSLCWSRLRDLPPDLAGSALPGPLQTQWENVAVQADVARAEFNKRVDIYNEAIHQFPALLLAWVFGFKPAMPV